MYVSVGSVFYFLAGHLFCLISGLKMKKQVSSMTPLDFGDAARSKRRIVWRYQLVYCSVFVWGSHVTSLSVGQGCDAIARRDFGCEQARVSRERVLEDFFGVCSVSVFLWVCRGVGVSSHMNLQFYKEENKKRSTWICSTARVNFVTQKVILRLLVENGED